MKSQLLGQPVNHTTFGEGIITNVSSTYVTIHFSQGDKQFIYPEAFSKFLTLKDRVKQKEVNVKYIKMLKEEEAVQKKECEEKDRLRQIRAIKITPNSQAAFNIAPAEKKSVIECGRVSTGCYLSGYFKGESRIPNKLKPNSVCLLTGLPKGKEEKNRRIYGAFMVRDDFWGERCKNGIVEGHNKYRIYLPSDINLSYWDYFEHGDNLPSWGNVPFKYFANSTMQKILLDMINLLVATKQESDAKEFYQYFCIINRLPEGQGNA